MIEAAVLFPIIIVTSITIVLIVMFFYSQMKEQMDMHGAIRYEMSVATGKTRGFNISDYGGEIKTQKTIYGDQILAKNTIGMDFRGILREKEKYVLEDQGYSVKGVEYVRTLNLLKGK